MIRSSIMKDMVLKLRITRLYGMMACVVPARQWAEKNHILAHVQAFTAPGAQDTFDLPENLDMERA